MLPTALAHTIVERTSVRATADEPNISSPSSCLLRSTLVFTTFCALGENTSASTITIPAATKKRMGVWALFIRLPMRNPAGSLLPWAI